ncbi:hypothetical protein BDV24DRAFT_160480 [Aspergillus arachidicola]|uniref:Uncharacterized protein n=1 Tax=Aspergillus arachidicola TaxID=656916 RepID=A0A5N6YFT4_9EURO|nr:hypothetical protein BDV24DRAFT_160480 [Aspergillus arachidicola]
MSSTFFPEEYWLGKTLEVSSPPSVWKLTEKVMKESETRDRKSIQEYGSLSYARAEFKCYNSSDPYQQARVTIYLQLPAEESMYLPPSMRRREATDRKVREFDELVEAYRRLTFHGCDFMPQFLGSSHGRQGDDGLVPGGFLSYLVFTSVPGDFLGTGTIGFDFGGRGSPRAVLNLSQEDQKRCRKQRIPDGMFWALSPAERTVIRQQFESAYTILCNIGVDLPLGTLSNLTWDRRTQRLYFFGQLSLAETRSTWPKKEIASWGLALLPIKPQGAECDESELIL